MRLSQTNTIPLSKSSSFHPSRRSRRWTINTSITVRWPKNFFFISDRCASSKTYGMYNYSENTPRETYPNAGERGPMSGVAIKGSRFFITGSAVTHSGLQFSPFSLGPNVGAYRPFWPWVFFKCRAPFRTITCVKISSPIRVWRLVPPRLRVNVLIRKFLRRPPIPPTPEKVSVQRWILHFVVVALVGFFPLFSYRVEFSSIINLL